MKTPDQEFVDAMVVKLDAIGPRPKKVLTGGLYDARNRWKATGDHEDHIVLTGFGWQAGIASRFLIDYRPPRDHTERFRATMLFLRRAKPGEKIRSLIIWRGPRSPWRTLNTYNGDTVPPYVAVDGAIHPGRRWPW